MEMGICFVAGMFTGFFIAFLLTFRTKPKKTKPEMHQTPKIIEKRKLEELVFVAAVSKTGEDLGSDEACCRIHTEAKNRLARQFRNILDEYMRCENDYIRNCFIFKIHIWVAR